MKTQSGTCRNEKINNSSFIAKSIAYYYSERSTVVCKIVINVQLPYKYFL